MALERDIGKAGSTGTRLSQPLMGTPLVIAVTLIYYALVVVGLVSWGRVVSVALMSTYVAQAPELLDELKIPAAACVLAVAMAFLAFWGIALAYIKRFDWIAPAVVHRVCHCHSACLNRGNSRRRARAYQLGAPWGAVEPDALPGPGRTVAGR